MKGDCIAGERCSCGTDEALRAKCNLWRPDAGEATKVYGLLAFHAEQKPLIEAHCFGDCGKVSAAGCILDDTVGGFWVCTEEKCPYLDKQMDEPYGRTMSFGRPHDVYIRTLKEKTQHG